MPRTHGFLTIMANSHVEKSLMQTKCEWDQERKCRLFFSPRPLCAQQCTETPLCVLSEIHTARASRIKNFFFSFYFYCAMDEHQHVTLESLESRAHNDVLHARRERIAFWMRFFADFMQMERASACGFWNSFFCIAFLFSNACAASRCII